MEIDAYLICTKCKQKYDWRPKDYERICDTCKEVVIETTEEVVEINNPFWDQ